MLSPNLDTIRLFVHVFAASVWVGGQVVLAGLVPALRRAAPDAVPVAARAFARVAWPAFAVAVVTGIWNLVDIDVATTTTTYQVTLFVKITVVFVSGAAAAIHQIGNSRAAKAVGGALGMSAALAAMFVGYLLTAGT